MIAALFIVATGCNDDTVTPERFCPTVYEDGQKCQKCFDTKEEKDAWIARCTDGTQNGLTCEIIATCH